KFNLAAAFSHTHKDVARPSEGGVPFHHVSSRLNTNLEKAKHPGTLPEKYGGTKFKNSFQLSGWIEIRDIHLKLRAAAKKYWKETGRGDDFFF
ncbi:MAG: hypothetical protein CMA42_05900, partial [Euryarchaeota archaeon]|nr:hypothetical protein [Euryarchaeota archaeon]